MVHQAPAFGEVDFDVLRLPSRPGSSTASGPALICAVAPDGTFTARPPITRAAGSRSADRDIIRSLRAEGKLLHQEQYLHDYPFCWRAEEDPLIQYPRKSWFIRTTRFKDRMLANNRADPLAAGAHPRRPLWQLPGNQCRLGPLARAVLGHAAADLGLRRDGLHGGGGQLRRAAGQARRRGHRGLGERQAGQSFAVRASEGPQAVHRRGHLRLAARRRANGCAA